jgi:tetratricopeptide (TPR) repeat protein
MKVTLRILAIAVASLLSTNANAWFFFFFPIPTGGGGSASTDNTCVAETAKEGDTHASPSGNIAKITKLSGTSSRCKEPDKPIVATVDYTSTVSFTSKAGINLPEKYKPITLTDRQRYYEGILLRAKTDDGKLYIQLTSVKRSIISSVPEFVKKRKDGHKNLDDFTTSEIQELTVNAFPAWRYEQKGKLKGLFGSRMIMLHTVIESKDEVLVLEAWGYENDYPDEAETFKKLPFEIQGLTPPTVVAVATPQAAIAKEQPPSVVDEKVAPKPPATKSAALLSAQESVADNPDKADSWNMLGAVHLDEQNYEKALIAFNEALKRNPKSTDALFGLGSTYSAMGNKDKVRAIYSDLKKYDGKQAAAYFKRFLLP